eukprot:GFUD01023591.1.p1 GENE.GFUD01023591.1~~GFUD01023591.1.p1  ORF type:complete len:592 (+),score=179.14 GFUD01023591.1:44-1819(+)
MATSNPRPAFMASLQSLCKNVDRQVADLERDTRSAVLATKGPYASNAADQLRDEAAALASEIEHTIGTVSEEKNNMASFLDEMKVQFGDIVADTLEMEEFMGQYGYVPKTPVILEDILNWDVPQESSVTPAAAGEFVDEALENIEAEDTSVHETDTVTAVTVAKPKSRTPPVQQKSSGSESPNFFDVGLSSLAMELFTGKSVRSNQPKVEQPQPRREPPPAIGQSQQANLKVQHRQERQSVQPISASAYIQDDSMYQASPVMKLSSHLTKTSKVSNMSRQFSKSSLDNILRANNPQHRQEPQSTTVLSPQVHLKPQPHTASDYIEDDSMYAASPALRLSSKLIKQTDLSNMSNVSNMSTLDSVDITPGLPSRKKASAPAANLPDSPGTPITAKHAFINAMNTENDTPVMPELQTCNFASFNWQQSSSASPDLPVVKSQSRPTVTLSRPITPDLPISNLASSDTPELPDLQTMDIRKLVLESKPMRRVTPTEPSLLTRDQMCQAAKENTPEEPQLTGHYNQLKHLSTQLTTEKENTPEEPHLHYQPHLANAFPLPKKNTPELPELSILQDRQSRVVSSDSPKTPVLSFNFRN